MCLLTLRSTDNKDGTIQQDDPAICKDGRQDFNIQQVPSIEEHEREAATSYIKTPCSIRKKLEAAINLDRSFNADAVWEEDFGELRATLESADDNLKTQMLHNQTNNLKEDHPKLEMEKGIMCLKTEKITHNTDGEIEEENMKMEVLNEIDWIYSPFTVEKENKSIDIDNKLLSDIDGFTYQQNKTGAIQFQRNPVHCCCRSRVFKNLYTFPLQREKLQNCFRDTFPLLREQLRNFFRDEFIMQREKLRNIFREKKEHIRHMFLMLFIIFLIKNISDNVKYRQTSCRKYPSLNSILYLLWRSGDVEANPGPANSTMYRKWLYDTCSVVRKAIAGVPAECKMSNIWKKKPENWPNGESYFDPRNSKGLTVNKVEDFLQILIRCCDDTSKLSHEITSEIYTWNSHRSKDNDQLLHLYRTRGCLKSTEQVERSLKVLQSHLLPDETLTVDVNPCIRISLSCKPALHQQLITHTIYRAEATRKISSFLCRILHGKDPERKCDHIWTLLPDGWPSRLRYYNPNNGGERCAENEDGMVVEALITLCEKKSIILSKLYQDMVNAWQAGNQTLLSKLLKRHTAETDLKKAVMKLHEERLLQDPEVDKQLRELGLFVQCDGSTQNVISQKRKKVNTMNKHETKRTKQSDHEDAVDTTVKELLPNWSIDQLIDNQNDSFLLEKIIQNIPDLLGDEADDIHFPWNQ